MGTFARTSPSPYPCSSCPYRQDVPSGVWDEIEYAKLPDYDLDTPSQPTAAFFCHQQNGHLCSGWVGCHDMDNSLGLQLAVSMGVIDTDAFAAALDYQCPVPLWETGTEAAAHGRAGIREPDDDARRTIAKLVTRRERREIHE